MTDRVLVFIAEGFEEIEAVTLVDVLRRAEIPTELVGVEGSLVTGAHGIAVSATLLLSKLVLGPTDAIVLPGGMPGSAHLRDNLRVRDLLQSAFEAGSLVGAICAAPIALEAAGILKGKRATGYPGFSLPSAIYSDAAVVIDGNIITSRAPGTALQFALALVERIRGREISSRLAADMLTS